MPDWNFLYRPPIPIIEELGGYRFDPRLRLLEYGVQPSFLDQFLANTQYWQMNIPNPPYGGAYYGNYDNEPALVLSFMPPNTTSWLEGLIHEAAHGFYNQSTGTPPALRAPQYETPLAQPGFMGVAKRIPFDPNYGRTHVGQVARDLAQTNPNEMFASLTSATMGNLNALPESLRGFWSGFLTPPVPSPMRQMNKVTLPTPPPKTPIWTNPSVQAIINARRLR